MATSYEDLITNALNAANTYATYDTYTGLPEYTPSQSTAPTKMDYVDYTGITPLEKVTALDYQNGLLGGDYDALQKALTTPGEIAANTAYKTGYNNLTNQMGGRGLYGSSIMQNQATTNLDSVYQNALATNAANAAASRYTLQEQAAEDMNQYNATMYGSKLQAANDQWKSNLLSTQDKREYDTNKLAWDKSYADALTAWENAKAYEKYQYDVANTSAYDAYEQNRINNYLKIAGQSTTSESANDTAYQNYLNYLQSISDSNTKYSTASQAGWLGAAGSIGAGLLSSDTGSSIVDSIGDTGTSTLEGLYKLISGYDFTDIS